MKKLFLLIIWMAPLGAMETRSQRTMHLINLARQMSEEIFSMPCYGPAMPEVSLDQGFEAVIPELQLKKERLERTVRSEGDVVVRFDALCQLIALYEEISQIRFSDPLEFYQAAVRYASDYNQFVVCRLQCARRMMLCAHPDFDHIIELYRSLIPFEIFYQSPFKKYIDQAVVYLSEILLAHTSPELLREGELALRLLLNDPESYVAERAKFLISGYLLCKDEAEEAEILEANRLFQDVLNVRSELTSNAEFFILRLLFSKGVWQDSDIEFLHTLGSQDDSPLAIFARIEKLLFELNQDELNLDVEFILEAELDALGFCYNLRNDYFYKLECLYYKMRILWALGRREEAQDIEQQFHGMTLLSPFLRYALCIN